jgi:hypothetical protein
LHCLHLCLLLLMIILPPLPLASRSLMPVGFRLFCCCEFVVNGLPCS